VINHGVNGLDSQYSRERMTAGVAVSHEEPYCAVMNRAKVIGALVFVVLLWAVIGNLNQTKLIQYDNCISNSLAVKHLAIQKLIDTGSLTKENLATFNYSTALDECAEYRPWW